MTGGTGRFAQATGMLTFSGVADLRTSALSETIRGEITNVGPQPAQHFSAEPLGWFVTGGSGFSPTGPMECGFNRLVGYRCQGTSLGVGETATIHYQMVLASPVETPARSRSRSRCWPFRCRRPRVRLRWRIRIPRTMLPSRKPR